MWCVSVGRSPPDSVWTSVREQSEQAGPDSLSVDVVLVISDKGSASCV